MSADRLLLSFLLFLGACSLRPAFAYNYCNNETLCPKGVKHFMCDSKQIVTASSGKYVIHCPMTNKLRQLYLDLHNKFRNEVASGESDNGAGKKFPKAARMRELIWDKELAYIAYVHAGTCSFEHDKCHNTVRFPMSGQNLGLQSSTKELPVIDSITGSLTDMYLERNKVSDPDSFAKAYKADLYKGIAGHFTLMMNDQMSRVGCSLAYCQNCPKKYCHYMTCNYDMINVEDLEIYVTSTAAGSKCSDWGSTASSKFSSLCTNTGKLFPLSVKK